jgi:hypothetical protein
MSIACGVDNIVQMYRICGCQPRNGLTVRNRPQSHERVVDCVAPPIAPSSDRYEMSEILTRGNVGVLIGVGMILLAVGCIAYAARSAANRNKRYRKGIAHRKESKSQA